MTNTDFLSAEAYAVSPPDRRGDRMALEVHLDGAENLVRVLGLAIENDAVFREREIAIAIRDLVGRLQDHIEHAAGIFGESQAGGLGRDI